MTKTSKIKQDVPIAAGAELRERLEKFLLSTYCFDVRCEVCTDSILQIIASELAAARDAALEEAIQAAKNAPFRCHASDDVDFHSGCVQTKESIVDEIRALRGSPRAEGQGTEGK